MMNPFNFPIVGSQRGIPIMLVVTQWLETLGGSPATARDEKVPV